MGSRLISSLRHKPPAFWINLGVKTILICLLAFGAFSGLQQFKGKAFLWRLATYPVAALVVPIIWATRRRGAAPSTKSASPTKSTYPFAADILLALPFLIDTVGNTVDFYDSIWWWDDVNHLVNWALLSGAVGAQAWRSNVQPWQTLAFVMGFGAVTAILWELAAYFAFIRLSSELEMAYAPLSSLETAYVDTLGDMALGLSGSVLAGLAAVLAPHRQRT